MRGGSPGGPPAAPPPPQQCSVIRASGSGSGSSSGSAAPSRTGGGGPASAPCAVTAPAAEAASKTRPSGRQQTRSSGLPSVTRLCQRRCPSTDATMTEPSLWARARHSPLGLQRRAVTRGGTIADVPATILARLGVDLSKLQPPLLGSPPPLTVSGGDTLTKGLPFALSWESGVARPTILVFTLGGQSSIECTPSRGTSLTIPGSITGMLDGRGTAAFVGGQVRAPGPQMELSPGVRARGISMRTAFKVVTYSHP